MKKPSTCPKCGSENIWRTFVKPDGDNAEVYSVLCKSCRHTWLEHYKTELTNIEEPESRPDLKLGVSLWMTKKMTKILFRNLAYYATVTKSENCEPHDCADCCTCLFYAKEGKKHICMRIPVLQAANLLDDTED